MRTLHFVAALLAACATLTAQPALAQDGRWLRAETASFIVYSDRGERALRDAAEELEDLDTTLRLITGLEAPPAETKLEVFLLNARDFHVVWPDAAESIRGFYAANAEAMLTFAIFADVGVVDRDRILYHEYAHHFMLHHFPDAYPAWYIEGFAEYASTIYFRHRRVTVGAGSERSYELAANGIMDTAALISPQGRADQRFYSTSWLATTYVLNDRERMEGLRRYTAALGEGQDPVEAFEQSFGLTPEQFDRELVSFANGRMQRLRFDLAETPPQVTVTRMPAVMDDLLLRVARARLLSGRGESEEETAEAAGEIERYAGAFAGQPYAERALARAALLRNDRASARARLAPVIAADRNDVEAIYLMARSYVDEAEDLEDDPDAQDAALSEARRLLVRGFRVDPNHFPTLYLHARTNQAKNHALADDQMAVLERAFTLAPQVAEIRMGLARELMMQRRWDEAQVVLRPLMYSPHYPQRAAAARALMQSARNHGRPPDPEETEDAAQEEEG